MSQKLNSDSATKAGDYLWTVNGEYVIIEKIQHELFESPVKVYNFRVAENHTYFVGKNGIGVHNNTCAEGNGGSGGNKPQDYQKMLDGLNDNKAHYIIEGSKSSNHQWEKLVTDKNWSYIKGIIKQVLEIGTETPYKNVNSKIANINGHDVQVVYTYKPDGSIVVSDGWVIN